MIIGSSKGSNAIWIDADLYQGRTRACGTFDSPQLLEGGEDFTLKTLECWAFEAWLNIYLNLQPFLLNAKDTAKMLHKDMLK